MRSAGYHEKMIGRTYFGVDQVTQLNLVLYNTIKWPNQPKHNPSRYPNVGPMRESRLLFMGISLFLGKYDVIRLDTHSCYVMGVLYICYSLKSVI